jgi:hypothetical protein
LPPPSKYDNHPPPWGRNTTKTSVTTTQDQANSAPNITPDNAPNTSSWNFGLKHGRSTDDTETADANKRIRLHEAFPFPFPDIPGLLYLNGPPAKVPADPECYLCLQGRFEKRTVECKDPGCRNRYYHLDCQQRYEKISEVV